MAESVNAASVMLPVLLVAPAATVKELNECSKARITFPPVPSSAEMLFIVIGIPKVFVTEDPSTNSCREKRPSIPSKLMLSTVIMVVVMGESTQTSYATIH